jgi:hypothetical protein
VPARGDGEQWRARVEDDIAALTAAVAELAAQLAELVERRGVSPGPATARAKPRHRRGDGILRVVRVGVGIAVCLTLALTAMNSATRAKVQQYSPRCAVQCARPVAHNGPTGPPRGR